MPSRNLGIIIPCAGKGTRMQTDGKALLTIHGIPSIVMACRPFLTIAKTIVVPTLAHQQASIQALFSDHQIDAQVIVGGETRYDSVYKGFDALEGVDGVLIHDGARPFVTHSLIERLIEASMHHSAVVPVLPIPDTLKQVQDGFIVNTVDRTNIMRVQTPQYFKYDLLKKAYCHPHNPTEMTDESRLIEAMGHPVYTILGEPSNVKLTYPEDLINPNAVPLPVPFPGS